MNCGWKELMAILPAWLRQSVENPYRESLQEIRLRTGKPVQLIYKGGQTFLQRCAAPEDLHFAVNTACRYSPWTAVGASNGFITAPGGHRIGLCGDAIMENKKMTGIRTLRSINIRVARDFPGIARELSNISGSILILGPPGSGKTTLLRDLLRQLSCRETVAVVDERGELFPGCFDIGQALDILTGCGKLQGLDAVVRTMSPVTAAVDEITAPEDCQALINALWCGVRLVATAHAATKRDLESRPIYKSILETGVFETLVILQADKSFRTERITG